jgi:hypothetical protein
MFWEKKREKEEQKKKQEKQRLTQGAPVPLLPPPPPPLPTLKARTRTAPLTSTIVPPLTIVPPPPTGQIERTLIDIAAGQLGNRQTRNTTEIDQRKRDKGATKTFYHVTSNKDWVKRLVGKKGENVLFDDLNSPWHGRTDPTDKIDPGYEGRNRTDSNPGGKSGRLGDDLGPGFYVNTDPKMAEYYYQKYFKDSVDAKFATFLKFEMDREQWEEMKKARRMAKLHRGDEQTYKEVYRSGFNPDPALTHKRPILDIVTERKNFPSTRTVRDFPEIMRGPVQDVVEEKSQNIREGFELRLGPDAKRTSDRNVDPTKQIAFTSEEAVADLYNKSRIIEAIDYENWKKLHPSYSRT